MNKNFIAAVGVLSALACGAASAQEAVPAGAVVYDTAAFDALPWYVSGKVGIALPGTIDTSTVPGPFLSDVTGKSSFDPGFAGAASVGKYLTPQVRAELELAIATNAGRSFEGEVALLGPTSGTLTGNVTTTSVMVMGYYDFTQFGDFVPYLGVGVGGANVNSNLTYTETAGFTFSDGTITGNSTVIAARVGAGFQYRIADSVAITADYTAMFGGSATLDYTSAGGFITRKVTSNVMGHALAVGIKGNF